MKQCTKCKKIKPANEFYMARGKTRTACKKCYNLDSAIWRKKNPLYKTKSAEYIKMCRKNTKDKYGLGAGTVMRFGFRLALEVYERFNRKCIECGEENDLTIHHLDNKGRNYLEKGLKPNNGNDNLVILCRRCHGSIHGKEGGRKSKARRC